MDKIELYLDENLLSRIATGSLVGLALNKGFKPGMKVVLQFEQTSLAWRIRNNGPNEYILPEYLPMCLAQGVLDLIQNGAIVEVEEIIV